MQRDAFCALASTTDPPLEELALALAAEFEPVDERAVRGQLDVLAEDARPAVAAAAGDPAAELEALSTVPRDELAKDAAASAEQVAERIQRAGIPARAEHRAGPVVRGLCVFAEEQEADMIVVGATSRGPVARRMLGTVTSRLIERSRRPVLVITPPQTR